MAVSLRKFPFPYRNMLAILSDTDLSSHAEFEGMHRFLNTEAECHGLGRGVGLDVGDTFWMATLGHDDDGSAPSATKQAAWRYWWADTRREIFAPEMRRYLSAGWIDAPHTFFSNKRGSSRFTRDLVSEVLREWKAIGFYPLIWIDHARNPWNIATYHRAQLTRSTNAGETVLRAIQSDRSGGKLRVRRLVSLTEGDHLAFAGTGERVRVAGVLAQEPAEVILSLVTPLEHTYAEGAEFSIHPARKPVEGAVPGSPYYCVDLAIEAGIKAYWQKIPSSIKEQTDDGRKGFATTLTPLTLPDGKTVWGMCRYYEVGQANNTWLGACINRVLDGDAERGGPMRPDTYMILSTHLGYADRDGDANNRSIVDDVYEFNGGRWFNDATVKALRTLRAAQDAGRVLVARTSRLVQYNLVHDILSKYANMERGYKVVSERGIQRVMVDQIHDDLFGPMSVSVDELRGITFYCENPALVEIWINGSRVDPDELQVNPPDHTGCASIGVRWYARDNFDYTDTQIGIDGV